VLDTVLDELAATLEEIRATVQELDTQLSEAWDSFLIRVAHRLYRFGYRLQGEEYELYDREDWE
jgi:hypothetical protein